METDSTTFTDCVNCLVAFTNSRCSPDVSLNAIAFLRFCALELAEGALGNLEEMPDPAAAAAAAERRQESSDVPQPTQVVRRSGKGTTSFTDADAHLYFWFPLLAGLSELTFDTRRDVRHSALEASAPPLQRGDLAIHPSCLLRLSGPKILRLDNQPRLLAGPLAPLFPPHTSPTPPLCARVSPARSLEQVLFDTLKFHGDNFSESFWARVFDKILFPIFDHVRAEGLAAGAGGEIDAWLYETCTHCLHLIVELFAQFYAQARAEAGARGSGEGLLALGSALASRCRRYCFGTDPRRSAPPRRCRACWGGS